MICSCCLFLLVDINQNSEISGENNMVDVSMLNFHKHTNKIPPCKTTQINDNSLLNFLVALHLIFQMHFILMQRGTEFSFLDRVNVLKGF